jgi:CheY-like chemotaxis protein
MAIKRILWIEDEPFQLEGMIRPLKKAGYEITTAIDAIDAYKFVKEKVFDLIILDVLIPIGKKESINIKDPHALIGIELLKKFKMKSFNLPPIILFSVVDLTGEMESLEQYNVKKILVKHNYLPSQLKKDVEEVLY